MTTENSPSSPDPAGYVIQSLLSLVNDRDVTPVPPRQLAAIEGFSELYTLLMDLRQAIQAIGGGDLDQKIKSKGYLAGGVKDLQASLRHLTWQTTAIASGDFTHRVDFMGEFSRSFNRMVQQLDLSMKRLRENEAILRKTAQTDALTGGHNSGYFTELFEKEVDRCQRYQRPLSVLMLDIDHFKIVNDTYGHAAGDEALRTLAGFFRSLGLRQTDFWGRLGGEEFALVLPETEITPAATVAERLRSVVSAATVVHAGKSFCITVSIGISGYRVDDTFKALLSRADQAMYEAKRAGRNRVCVSHAS